MKKLTGAKTKLEKAVQATCNSYADNYGDGVKGFLKDLFYGGCQSGVVGGLIYYKDTIAFYKRHKTEIKALLRELKDATGCTTEALFGDKWDQDDCFADETQNQNLLACFGFEETARKLADQNGIEV